MEFPLTSQDKMDKMEHSPQRIFLFTMKYVTNKNVSFREKRLLRHITDSLLTSLLRSVQ